MNTSMNTYEAFEEGIVKLGALSAETVKEIALKEIILSIFPNPSIFFS